MKLKMKMLTAMMAMLPIVAAFGSTAPAHGDGKMVWGLMMQLGHNMWGEEPLTGTPQTEAEKDKYACDYNRTDEKLWHEVTEYAAKKGVNLLLIDLGEETVGILTLAFFSKNPNNLVPSGYLE